MDKQSLGGKEEHLHRVMVAFTRLTQAYLRTNPQERLFKKYIAAEERMYPILGNGHWTLPSLLWGNFNLALVEDTIDLTERQSQFKTPWD